VRVFKFRNYCDVAMVLLFCLSVTVAAAFAFESVPNSQFELERRIVPYNPLLLGSNDLLMLPKRNFDNFTTQEPFKFPSLENC
jgi:hypothetical protein